MTRQFAILLSMLALAGCGGDAAPPEPGEGAVGLVAVDDAGAAEAPTTPALSGGPAGQAPDYGETAGVGSVISSGAPPEPAPSPDPGVSRRDEGPRS